MAKFGRFALVTAAIAAAGFAAMRAPAVEDRLFDAALDKAMNGAGAALFDGDGLKVFFCGTGSPLPSARRAQTCTAVIAGDWFFLVDVGSGSFETVQAAGLPANRLAGVFLTHFHSDHIGDLSEANLGSWVTARPAPLSVFGPTGVEQVVAGENEAFALDAGYRIAHHGPKVVPPSGYGLAPRPVAPGVVFNADGLVVTAFAVDHGPVKPAYGYRFDYKGRSLAISGDTAPSASLERAVQGVDVLVHEALSPTLVAEQRQVALAAGRPGLAKILADIPSYHTSPEAAADIAKRAKVGTLLLTHIIPPLPYSILEGPFLGDARSRFPGRLILGRDGDELVLPVGNKAVVQERRF